MLPAGLATGSAGSRLQHMGGVPQGFLTASLGISLDLGSSFSLKGPRTPLGHQNFWRLKTIIFLLSFLGG